MSETGLRYDPDQERAVETAIKESVMVLTGGPGVGKTTTVNNILLNLSGLHVRLAAPTGKAARRMSESCGYPAVTIHRLLEYSERFGGFTRCRQNPIEADAVIIDESSMMDIRLAASLFQAIPDGAKLILVGDKDQLPSVGPGNVLRDLIDSRRLPVVELTTIHRQVDESSIPHNAQRINRGEPLILGSGSEDFFFHGQEDARDARQEILRLITEVIPARHGLNPMTDVQLLCPMKKGPIGVFELNKELQNILNPPEKGKNEFSGFRVGDKVIHIRNNYDLEVMNGECGLVTRIEGKPQEVGVDFGDREVVYGKEALDDLTLSYAMTVHKSQGSEWPAVVIPIHSSNYIMLTRNLFYTAVTRGKALVYVVGNQRGLKRAIKNNASTKRYSGLGEALKKAA